MKLKLTGFLLLTLLMLLVITFLNSFLTVCYSEGLTDFPVVVSFSDLDVTENLKVARSALKCLSGIYCISPIDSGTL